jgi:hypothetical protein
LVLFAPRRRPPAARYPFPGVAVTALFVPWQGSARLAPRLTAWREWFVGAGASAFTMADEVQSQTLDPLPPGGVPKRLANPFLKVGR